MRITVRYLGHICIIVAAGWMILWLARPGKPGQLLPAAGWFIGGIMLLALEEVLNRLRYIEFLLEIAPGAKTQRVKTALGDFQLLEDAEGDAICIGCKKTAAKAGLYYSKSLDVHYHPACLARDRKR